MTIKQFIGKFKSGNLWGNLAAMVGVVIVLAWGFKFAVDIYTHHGESIAIPNVVHKSFEDAQGILNDLDLEMVVNDTGYVKTLPPGCILEQFPEAGEHVKAGHTIYVTINATHTPTITLPDVIDNSSLREATARLTSMGFKLNPPEFVAGEKDWVYGITVNGRHVVAGDRIPVDARLTIQAGNGLRDMNDSVDYIDPDIITDDEGSSVDEFEEVTSPVEDEPEPEPKSEPEKKTPKKDTEAE